MRPLFLTLAALLLAAAAWAYARHEPGTAPLIIPALWVAGLCLIYAADERTTR